jgi:GNAT superfamily N-acetyltransferase
VRFERRRGEFLLSDDAARFDVDAIHGALVRSYWAEGIPREIVERSIRGSLCLGLFDGESRQVGFARAITDRATYAYLADVYVLEELRGQGLGSWLVGTLLDHPDLQGLRRLALMTRDAHELYRRFGFGPAATPQNYMEIARPGLYRKV